MSIFDQYILHIFVFCPLVASIFIMLIPTTDVSSRLATSKFFSLLGFLAFLRLFILFLGQNLPHEIVLSLGSAYFRVNLSLFISKYNIFLFGTISALLFAHIFTAKSNKRETNIHHVAPFLLTFTMYICFSQNDLRVALPILSITNFLVYFMIASSDKARRGTTIFQMGIFLFSCDALALIMLQIPEENFPKNTQTLFAVLIVIPGLARMCMPMLAPFAKKLYLNVDHAKGSFLIIFEQMSGFLILTLIKIDLNEISALLIGFISITTILSSIYIGLTALFDKNISIMPHFFLTFYSSVAIVVLFSPHDNNLFISLMIFYTTNIFCFFFMTRFLDFADRYTLENSMAGYKVIYYLGITLIMGIPGLGIGTSFWQVIHNFIALNITGNISPKFSLSLTIFSWLLVLLLLGKAMMLSIAEKTKLKRRHVIYNVSYMSGSLIFMVVVMVLVAWLIPLGIYLGLES